MKKILLSITMVAAFTFCAMAQSQRSDMEEENLRGPVATVLTTTRGAHGQIVGHPIRHTFNAKGDLERATYYDTAGTPVLVVAYHYDRHGRLERETRTLGPFSELLLQSTYTYDKKNHSVTSELLGVIDSLCEHVVYTYDKKGYLTKVTTYDDNDSILSQSRHRIDEHGNCIETTLIGKNDIYNGSETYRYDSDGNLVERCVLYMDQMRQRFLYAYTFDEHGNWTKCFVVHLFGNTAEIYQTMNREISYLE